ncbi:hypothetical protein ACF3N7_05400 [Cruoricaptor ignavus]|uniref:hypothetical protein n=1 Tax=Cruoricaptor ignavus TaxID=1118202 RepID=UPI00370D8C73
MKIGKEIALEARKCKKVPMSTKCFREISQYSHVKFLCEKWFSESNWAMENDFPSPELLRKFKGNADRYGLLVDYAGDDPGMRRAAFFGKSDVKIIANNYDVRELYIRQDTVAEIDLSGNAFVVLNVLDSARADIRCTDNAKVMVYAYGDCCAVRMAGEGVTFKRLEF